MRHRQLWISLTMIVAAVVLSVTVSARSVIDRSIQDDPQDRLTTQLNKYDLIEELCKPQHTKSYDSTGGTQLAARPSGYVSLGTAGPADIASPGLSIIQTYDDWQYTYKGTRVDVDRTWSDPSIHFAYGYWTGPGAKTRFGYNVYDPTAGGSWPRGLGVGCVIQPTDEYGLWPNLTAYPDGRVAIAGMDELSGPYEHHVYGNAMAYGCFFGTGSIIPQGQYSAGFLNGSDLLHWPQVEIQVIGSDTVIHLIARENPGHLNGSATNLKEYVIQYFRAVGSSMIGMSTVWTGPITIDTAAARGHLTSSPVSNKVAVI